MGEPQDTRKPRAPRPCPICSKMSIGTYHPFCSKRCADIDLGRWLGERYSVPAEDPPDFIDPTAAPPGDDSE